MNSEWWGPFSKRFSYTPLGEGAPPPSAFSLADFMTALPTKNSSQDKVPAASKEQDFPALGASHPQSQGSNSNSTSSAWAHPPTQPPTAPSQTAKPSSEEKAPASSTSPCPASAYSIGKTKKGGLPVRVENRSKGKKVKFNMTSTFTMSILQVTVVFNVTGDLKLLLSELKQAAGSGGVVREDTIEIQGDKLQFVENFISQKIKKK